MGINAGRLRKKIEIWRYCPVEDSMGNTVNRLQKKRTVYGEMRPLRGQAYLEYYKEMHKLSYRCTIRYYKELLPTDVIVYEGRQFLIDSIINVNELNYIQEIMCTEKNENGKPVMDA